MELLGERLAALVPTQQLEIDVDALRADVVGREASLLGALAQILRVAPDPQEQTLNRCVQVKTPPCVVATNTFSSYMSMSLQHMRIFP